MPPFLACEVVLFRGFSDHRSEMGSRRAQGLAALCLGHVLPVERLGCCRMGNYLCTEMLGGVSRAQCAHNGSSEVVDTCRAGTFIVCARMSCM